MKKIVECVPNFSEGRNSATIGAIAAAIDGTSGVKLMGVEPDIDYNRTVVTFAGQPDAVVQAAVEATRMALKLIDMSVHQGEHPRLGAVDVVPFVPIAGVSMQDCVDLAKRYSRQVAEEFRIPVYLYEYAAASPERRNLADIRKGEYEGLPEKLRNPNWRPDFGPAEFNRRSGAVVAGARKFLIAYNVNLDTPKVEIAKEISERIRESGRLLRDETGKPKKDPQGEILRIPGSLKALKAMGVFLERVQIAQVSINLTDFEITPPHRAFEEVSQEAIALGCRATGSEIVGLTPLKALLMAGEYYAAGEPLPEQGLLQLAIRRLGLSQLDPFDPCRKVIEYQL